VAIAETFPTPEGKVETHPEYTLAAYVNLVSSAAVDQREYGSDRRTDEALK